MVLDRKRERPEWTFLMPKESVQNGRADCIKVDDQSVHNGRNKEEKAVDKAGTVAGELWTQLEADPSHLGPSSENTAKTFLLPEMVSRWPTL